MQNGDALPDVEVATTSGPLALRSLVGRPLVIYFYPKDSTPGCTRQANDFTMMHAQFQRAGVNVVGVSRDSLASHQRFRERQGIVFDLVSDPDETLCKAFDVIREKNMYGRTVVGIQRSTFLFDAKGLLVESWRGVKVPGHVEAVLAAAEAIA
ncbi:peroxiredoxin [Pseudofulvimonas gallinarii]|jgi:peroxiredoxin Q/BCP|uniref:thioredoxin-dependent peroxiredoxin n=1 Tax=Pseudofulvimonas gallinarii TaxID=634155 RepID=A0A4S3L0J7_9GAMM|nr:peroxiredoxin [Pseudofulvimonas gallinarii]TCS99718.1 peroxiredoxin Q/BCP [Pseudofulvimonas gallinarii]THD15245.1 peroxiredoxin [Pseudofulvimonas gallinarii]